VPSLVETLISLLRLTSTEQFLNDVHKKPTRAEMERGAERDRQFETETAVTLKSNLALVIAVSSKIESL